MIELESSWKAIPIATMKPRYYPFWTKRDNAQLNELMLRIDLSQLISDVDDRKFGPDNRTKLYDQLLGRLAQLSVDVRVALIKALQKGRTDKQEKKVIRDVFLGTFDSSLTALKNGIDAGGDYRDLQQLVHTDIDNNGTAMTYSPHRTRG